MARRAAPAVLVACVTAALACTDARGPQAAFDRLRVAVEAHDGRLLYGALDSDSRWAVESVWRTQRQLAAIVQARYPAGARERELKRLEPALRAATPADLFADLIAGRGDPFVELGGSAEGLGTWVRMEGHEVVTSTGKRVALGQGPNGAWGYSVYREELARWRGAAANDLRRIEEATETSRESRSVIE